MIDRADAEPLRVESRRGSDRFARERDIACLQQLDGRARELLERNYGSDASREAIAATMGLRAEGVKTYLRRVRDILRQCVLRRLAAEQEPLT